MVSIGALYAYFVLAFFAGCPTWGDGILVETRGCPDLYKETEDVCIFLQSLGNRAALEW